MNIKNMIEDKANLSLEKPKKRIKPAVSAAIAIAAVALVMTTALALNAWLHPSTIAGFTGDEGLSKAFESENAININSEVKDDGYIINLMAIVSGKDLSDFEVSGSSIDESRSYLVTAIRNEDETPISEYDGNVYLDDIAVSPFVKGENYLDVNIYTLGGGEYKTLRDGVIYFLTEVNNLNDYADKGVCIGVYKGKSIIGLDEKFDFDTEAKTIKPNPDYDGLNVVFDLPL